jgi:hypothetical protein
MGELLTTGAAAARLAVSDAQFRRIAAAHHLEPADRTINPHCPAGPLASLWRACDVEALAHAPDVVEARARRHPRTPVDELAQIATLLEPHARKGERLVQLG